MPATVTFGTKTIGFQYDADHNRVLRTQVGGPIPKIYYLPDGEDDSGTWHSFHEVDGERIAESYGAIGSLAHAYFHNDDQNTNGVDTSDADVVLQKKGADLFGQPRQQNGSTDPNWTGDTVTTRRFINQEDLVQAHLIDLNARLYDPLLGKFLSPDPEIANEDNSQAWNAYSYSLNNPMSKEDPTGRAPENIEVHAKRPKPKIIMIAASGSVAHLSSGLAKLMMRAIQGNQQARNQLAASGTHLNTAATLAASTAFGDALEDGMSVGEALQAAITTASDFAISNAVVGGTGGLAFMLAPNSVTAHDTCTSGACAVPSGTIYANSQNNTNPYKDAVSEPVIAVDKNGNAIPVRPGERIKSFPNGDFQQVSGKEDTPTGTRMDRGGHPKNSDPRAQAPHGHQPGYTTEDGNPHLPINPQ